MNLESTGTELLLVSIFSMIPTLHVSYHISHFSKLHRNMNNSPRCSASASLIFLLVEDLFNPINKLAVYLALINLSIIALIMSAELSLKHQLSHNQQQGERSRCIPSFLQSLLQERPLEDSI